MSEAAPTSAAAPAVPASPSAPPKSKLLPILLALNTLLILGVGGAVFFLMKGKPSHSPSGGEQTEPSGPAPGPARAPTVSPSSLPGPTIRLPDFVIRLRNPEQDRFARISFEVEVTEELDKDKITTRMARIRDAYIRYLSDRTVEELRGSEGLERVKSELQEMLIELAPDARVRGLYISDFVVQ